MLYTFLLLLPFNVAEQFECTMEKRDDENVCVYRNVVYRSKMTDTTWKAPAGKIQHVAFEDSSLETTPNELLNGFPDLRSLSVPNANLTSLIIPPGLERLYASNNRINRITVKQTRGNTKLTELMLDSNNLADVSNLTQLENLEILNLSGNKELPNDGTIDLGLFSGMPKLRHLTLSDMGIFYLENEKHVSLPQLELLDLSNNHLLTSNFDVKVLAPLKSLQYLWLGYNQLKDLNVLQLTKGNPQLKQIYLEGNHFKCDQQRLILDHLHKTGIETPVTNKESRCLLGFDKNDDMCCIPTMPGGGPQTPVTLPHPDVAHEEDDHMPYGTSTSSSEPLLVSGKEGMKRTTTPTPIVPKWNESKNEATTVMLAFLVAIATTLLVAVAQQKH
uniref:Leucine rich immune protein (Coil-less) n=1 Tax=Anopheles culicifacies TaxID=139723 RepID=A0A182MMC4_9DIPT